MKVITFGDTLTISVGTISTVEVVQIENSDAFMVSMTMTNGQVRSYIPGHGSRDEAVAYRRMIADLMKDDSRDSGNV